jgi:hypothetical protein
LFIFATTWSDLFMQKESVLLEDYCRVISGIGLGIW